MRPAVTCLALPHCAIGHLSRCPARTKGKRTQCHRPTARLPNRSHPPWPLSVPRLPHPRLFCPPVCTPIRGRALPLVQALHGRLLSLLRPLSPLSLCLVPRPTVVRPVSRPPLLHAQVPKHRCTEEQLSDPPTPLILRRSAASASFR
jgi:hypothetical protein